MHMKPLLLHIYLDSGTEIEVLCEDFDIHKDGLGRFDRFEIAGGIPRLLHLELESVVAISAEENALWMCNCGYEGDRNMDDGFCPICGGTKQCEWNG